MAPINIWPAFGHCGVAWTLLILLVFSVPLRAEVVHIEVTSRVDINPADAIKLPLYEEISGRIFFATSPHVGTNRGIVDIDKAPRNAAGKVNFSANFVLLKPKAPAVGNGTLLFEASNRGNRTAIATFNRSSPENPWGDGFLMQQGVTLLWVGWQFDVPDSSAVLRIDAPVASESDGSAIEGLVRSDAPNKGQWLELADRGHIPYSVTDPSDPANVLTVRDCIECERSTVPREQWQFNEDGKRVFISSGQPRKIYELVYGARNPPVAGLGFAAVRDTLSKIRYEEVPELSLPQHTIKRVLGFGASQGGRFLRTYIYDGFNEDESHRKVFDGLIVHAAGAGRGSFNHRFAQPSRDAHPYLNFHYPIDIFPFTDVAQYDPETKRSDGLMAHTAAEFLPNIFYTNASYEYWGRCASLIHTSIDGRTDVQVPSNVRIYFFAGGKHGSGGEPSMNRYQQRMSNPLDYGWSLRSLLLALNAWITDEKPPPPSTYPRIDNGTLVAVQRLKFTAQAGFGFPAAPLQTYRADYGPDFFNAGIITHDPPRLGSIFPVLVPQVGKDGNELAGIRMPELAVPLATYTGWDFMHPDSGLTNSLASGAGSFIPFARTRAERLKNHDRRRSLEERYRGRSQYLIYITKAANKLADEGYLLRTDVPAIVEQAGTRWDFVSKQMTR